MKKLKLVLWVVLIGFLGLVVYQNYPFFTETNVLKINLIFYQVQTPAMTNGAIIASFVGVGVLIMLLFYCSSRYEGYRSKKTIAQLEQTIESRSGEMAELKRQVDLLKQPPEAAPALPIEGEAVEGEAVEAETAETATQS
jgi:hypothetical protein